MSFLELLLLLFVLEYVLYVVCWCLLDCNLWLWYLARFGDSISTLRGQVVWITGASSGIGRALAVQLARHGVKLVLSARRETLLEQVQVECLRESNGLLADKDVFVLPMDMLELDKHEERFQQVLNHFGQLDILVNNAGRSQRANWQDIDVRVDRSLFELDVFSVVHLSRIVVRYFLQEAGGRGHIAATSSIAGIIGAVPFSATYCAAKHALNAYLRALAVEQPGIGVTIFAPGPIATDFLQEAFTAQPDSKYGQSTKDQKRMTANRCGQLFAVALANKLELAWCGLFPVNVLTYIALYWPLLARIVLKTVGRKTMNNIREGKI